LFSVSFGNRQSCWHVFGGRRLFFMKANREMLAKIVVRIKEFRKCSRNNQHYELIVTTPLFYILANTCFGSSLPSSGSFLDPSEFRRNHDTPAHRPHNHTLYDIPPIRFIFQVTQKDLRSSLMMAGYCRSM
jgi:hypothetical protein